MARKNPSAEKHAPARREMREMLAGFYERGQSAKAQARLIAQPEVGILFVVGNQLWIDDTKLSKAIDYGTLKIHDGGHAEFWDRLVAIGVVPPVEYDEIPRGRVAFDKREEKFHLFLDRCIITSKPMVSKIKAEFHLPRDVKPETDSHYLCPGCKPTLEEEADLYDKQ